MITKEEFEKHYKEKQIEYFKNNFIGKNINTILYDMFKEITIDLMKTYVKFIMISGCLDAIKNDKTVNKKSKKDISLLIKCINSISNDFEKILNSICEGIS